MNNLEKQTETAVLIERIITARGLGRSPIYAKLLNYFAEQRFLGNVCSEYSVAIDVFAKNDDYDVSADSTVRVYIYNLRKKLESYYADLGKHETRQLYIPKGEYRLLVRNSKDQQASSASTELIAGVASTPQTNNSNIKNNSSIRSYAALTMAAVLATALITTYLAKRTTQSNTFNLQQHQFWGGILTDKKPVMIVVGDYYIFAETTNAQGDIRLVREFDINSSNELIQSLVNQQRPNSINVNDRFDLSLTYLPRGSASAVAKIVQLLEQANKTPRISMMSEFSAEDLRANHVIYLGYLSGLNVLESYTFANSRFAIGTNYDELIDTQTGVNYRSDFIEAQEDRSFIDYGIISSFSLAADNQLVVLSGTRDAGLMEMSDLATSPNLLDRLQLNSANESAYEALFEVDGFNSTNIGSQLLISDYILNKQTTISQTNN